MPIFIQPFNSVKNSELTETEINQIKTDYLNNLTKPGGNLDILGSDYTNIKNNTLQSINNIENIEQSAKEECLPIFSIIQSNFQNLPQGYYKLGNDPKFNLAKPISDILGSPDYDDSSFNSGNWQLETITLPINLSLPNCSTIIIKDKLYLIGYLIGNGSSWTQSINTYYCDIVNGEISGNWLAGPNLNTAVSYSNNIVIGNYLYVIGGYTNGATVNSLDLIQRAYINNDGTLGNFVSLTFGRKISGNNVFILGNKIYSVGGHNGSTDTNQIWSAEFNEFGFITEAFVNTGYTTPINVRNHQIVRIKNYLYIFSIYNGSSWITDIYRAKIYKDNTFSNFEKYNISTPIAGGYTLIRLGNKIYLYNGQNGSNYYNKTYICNILKNGELTNFTEIGSNLLADANGWGSLIKTSKKLYSFGNSNGSYKNKNKIFSLPLLGNEPNNYDNINWLEQVTVSKIKQNIGTEGLGGLPISDDNMNELNLYTNIEIRFEKEIIPETVINSQVTKNLDVDIIDNYILKDNSILTIEWDEVE